MRRILAGALVSALSLSGALACSKSDDATTKKAPPDAADDQYVPPMMDDWPAHAGSLERLFYNPRETSITTANVGQLTPRWQFDMHVANTASPIVAHLELPEGRVPVVFQGSWENILYAIKLSDGSELWHFTATDQPGTPYPATGSAYYALIDDKPTLFWATGETMYRIDALTGTEQWRFMAGTGCGYPDKMPGSCSFTNERNEIESSAAVAGDNVVFGMDVNDEELGKGGFLAVDVRTGHMAWFFDVVTGSTCTPDAGDAITRFDGYHTASELGLPTDFLTTRAGCNFDRAHSGCGNIWSSAAVDADRKLLFFDSGNCDVDNDPTTTRPAPPGPPNEDAIIALGFDGKLAWSWRPRAKCPGGNDACYNADLDFGGVPNLFSIQVGGASVDVVGVGDKGGTYYVIDRAGVNSTSGLRWDAADASALPYWMRNVVAGGPAGGIIATAAYDPVRKRVYFGTAPGDSPLNPQHPTIHAVNAEDGTIVWQNTGEPTAQASFSPTSVIPEVVFTGSVFGKLRTYDPDDGAPGPQLAGGAGAIGPVASGTVVFDGCVLVGGGIGQRGPDPGDASDIQWRTPTKLIAYCLPGGGASD